MHDLLRVREATTGSARLVPHPWADRFSRPSGSHEPPDTMTDPHSSGPAGAWTFLRHSLATLAYRGAKALREAPPDFGDFHVGEGSRTPVQILAHIGDLLDWALSQAEGAERWRDASPGSWHDEERRFFAGLAALDARLATEAPLGQPAGRIFQGAIADALWHVGQIAMIRRLAGSPVRGENYNRADIVVGRVGPDQADPRREFD